MPPAAEAQLEAPLPAPSTKARCCDFTGPTEPPRSTQCGRLAACEIGELATVFPDYCGPRVCGA